MQSAHSADVHPTAGSPLAVCIQSRGRKAKPLPAVVRRQWSAKNGKPPPASGVGTTEQAWFSLLCGHPDCSSLLQIKTSRTSDQAIPAGTCHSSGRPPGGAPAQPTQQDRTGHPSKIRAGCLHSKTNSIRHSLPRGSACFLLGEGKLPCTLPAGSKVVTWTRWAGGSKQRRRTAEQPQSNMNAHKRRPSCCTLRAWGVLVVGFGGAGLVCSRRGDGGLVEGSTGQKCNRWLPPLDSEQNFKCNLMWPAPCMYPTNSPLAF